MKLYGRTVLYVNQDTRWLREYMWLLRNDWYGCGTGPVYNLVTGDPRFLQRE